MNKITDVMLAGGIVPLYIVLLILSVPTAGLVLWNILGTQHHPSQKAEYTRNDTCVIYVSDTTVTEFDNLAIWCKSYLEQDNKIKKMNSP